jgi:hypothetical protein
MSHVQAFQKPLRCLLEAAFMLFFLYSSTMMLAQERSAMARYGEAYTGYKGIRAYISPLADGKSALVQVAFVNHAWDRQIFQCDVETVKAAAGTRTQYSRSVDGKSWTMLIVWADGSGELYLQGENDARKITYNEAESREVNNEHQLTAYLEQQDKWQQEQRAAKKKK